MTGVNLRPLLALVAGLAMSAHAADSTLADFSAQLDAQWNFAQPAESAQRFRAELLRWPIGDPQALLVATQIARAQSLQRQFGDAHATLDAIGARLADAPSHVRVRYLLERGRTFNSAGAPEQAVPLFAEALSLAECASDEFYAVDAAHMLGIAAPPATQLDWNVKALAMADAATDPRARRWTASLHNNIGWTYHDRGDYAAALAHWEKALAARQTMGDAARTREAKWAVARGLRSLSRFDEAQAIQSALAAENDALGAPDGYVYEELMEIALARGDGPTATKWAGKALPLLKGDLSRGQADAARLARLAAIAAASLTSEPTPE
jgi:tetratricopeptide (TPR) repeat protein